jgi:predicted alpha-1,6-mannanase (GH76 family)
VSTASPVTAREWANRAAGAEGAITHRHLRRLWQLPGTQLGVVGWPPTAADRSFGSWHYWWQAHLLDTLVDAQLRDPKPHRVQRIRRQIRGHRIRNAGRWTNQYYDDMAWLALALERAGRLVGVEHPGALQTLLDELFNAWVPEDGGGIPWRKQDQFFNAPANGPAGIFLARCEGRLRRAEQMADWIEDTLIDPETKLVFDGIRSGSLVRAQYTYCQGVVVGLETELAVRTGEAHHAHRVRRLVAAIAGHMAPHGVLRGAGGGDGGLFAGITARYLALAATALPGRSPADNTARQIARDIVLASAQAAWINREVVEGLPLFGASWDRPAEGPGGGGARARSADGAVHGSEAAERDLSVQISGWMLMEAASAVTSRPRC